MTKKKDNTPSITPPAITACTFGGAALVQAALAAGEGTLAWRAQLRTDIPLQEKARLILETLGIKNPIFKTSEGDVVLGGLKRIRDTAKTIVPDPLSSATYQALQAKKELPGMQGLIDLLVEGGLIDSKKTAKVKRR